MLESNDRDEALFVTLPAIFNTGTHGHRETLLAPNGLVRDVYSALRWCVKGQERGASKGFIGDTK